MEGYYLDDGLYAQDEGFQIRLYCERDDRIVAAGKPGVRIESVYLSEEGLRELNKFASKIWPDHG